MTEPAKPSLPPLSQALPFFGRARVIAEGARVIARRAAAVAIGPLRRIGEFAGAHLGAAVDKVRRRRDGPKTRPVPLLPPIEIRDEAGNLLPQIEVGSDDEEEDEWVDAEEHPEWGAPSDDGRALVVAGSPSDGRPLTTTSQNSSWRQTARRAASIGLKVLFAVAAGAAVLYVVSSVPGASAAALAAAEAKAICPAANCLVPYAANATGLAPYVAAALPHAGEAAAVLAGSEAFFALGSSLPFPHLPLGVPSPGTSSSVDIFTTICSVLHRIPGLQRLLSDIVSTYQEPEAILKIAALAGISTPLAKAIYDWMKGSRLRLEASTPESRLTHHTTEVTLPDGRRFRLKINIPESLLDRKNEEERKRIIDALVERFRRDILSCLSVDVGKQVEIKLNEDKWAAYSEGKEVTSRQLSDVSEDNRNSVKLLYNILHGKTGEERINALETLTQQSFANFRPVGFVNTRNSCFLNAMLQALLAIPIMREKMKTCRNTHLKTIVEKYERGEAPLKKELDNLRRSLPRIGGTSATGVDLSDGAQHDAHEALGALLLMIEDVNLRDLATRIQGPTLGTIEAPTPPDPSAVSTQGYPEVVIHSDAFASGLKRALATALFGDELTSSSSAPHNSTFFTNPPKILPIHLLRAARSGKDTTDVDVPLTLQFPSQFITPRVDESDLSYDLESFTVHLGSSAGSGHYTAYRRTYELINGRKRYHYWEMDDGVVKEISKEAFSKAAKQADYVFYIQSKQVKPDYEKEMASSDEPRRPSPSLTAPAAYAATIDRAPPFRGYRVGIGARQTSLTSLNVRPANLFYDALGLDHTRPGTGELFRLTASHDQILRTIRGKPKTDVVSFTAKGKKGDVYEGDFRSHREKEKNAALEDYYGNKEYEISYGELQSALDSQKIHVAKPLPLEFYRALKRAMQEDDIVTLPLDSAGKILQVRNLTSRACQALIQDVQRNSTRYGFHDKPAMDYILNLNLYQLGAYVVKSEDFHIFLDENGQILGRKAGETDAVRLVSMCGIRPNKTDTNNPENRAIMQQTFHAALQAAGDGFAVFPAVGMGVWGGDPGMYWESFLDAVANSDTSLEQIFVNPSHQQTKQGRDIRSTGDEFQKYLDAYKQKYKGNARALANLGRIVNLRKKKTDLVQFARMLKQDHPGKTVSLVNASDPDVTLGNHVGEYVNKLCHADTTEENLTALGTNGICFETVTGVHERVGGVVQVPALVVPATT